MHSYKTKHCLAFLFCIVTSHCMHHEKSIFTLLFLLIIILFSSILPETNTACKLVETARVSFFWVLLPICFLQNMRLAPLLQIILLQGLATTFTYYSVFKLLSLLTFLFIFDYSFYSKKLSYILL
jgi:hypothetical protein